MASMDDLDKWVAKVGEHGTSECFPHLRLPSASLTETPTQVKSCTALEEDELKALCEYVRHHHTVWVSMPVENRLTLAPGRR